MKMTAVQYVGTGAVTVPGYGPVQTGETITMDDKTAQALMRERPGDWRAATRAKGTKADGGD